jgi:hypothetical protein
MSENEKLQSVDLRDFLPHKRTQRTYPGIFPVLHLDHICYAGKLEVVGVELPRTRRAGSRFLRELCGWFGAVMTFSPRTRPGSPWRKSAPRAASHERATEDAETQRKL